jgi:hypothetical protein
MTALILHGFFHISNPGNCNHTTQSRRLYHSAGAPLHILNARKHRQQTPPFSTASQVPQSRLADLLYQKAMGRSYKDVLRLDKAREKYADRLGALISRMHNLFR